MRRSPGARAWPRVDVRLPAARCTGRSSPSATCPTVAARVSAASIARNGPTRCRSASTTARMRPRRCAVAQREHAPATDHQQQPAIRTRRAAESGRRSSSAIARCRRVADQRQRQDRPDRERGRARARARYRHEDDGERRRSANIRSARSDEQEPSVRVAAEADDRPASSPVGHAPRGAPSRDESPAAGRPRWTRSGRSADQVCIDPGDVEHDALGPAPRRGITARRTVTTTTPTAAEALGPIDVRSPAVLPGPRWRRVSCRLLRAVASETVG